MIFWIVLGIVVVLLVTWIVKLSGYDSFGWGVAVVVGVIALGIVSLIGSSMPPTEAKHLRTETYDLQALGTRESGGVVRGVFLSSVVSNGQPGFNYIRENGHEDEYVMRFAQNYQAAVHTDEEEKPYVDITYWDWYNPLWVPWNTRDQWAVDFHVPEDSVSSEISVSP